MMELSVKQLLGQKLEYGFHGTALTEEFKDLIREYKIGNVIPVSYTHLTLLTN